MRSVAIRGADRAEARGDRSPGVHRDAAATGNEGWSRHDRRVRRRRKLARVRTRGFDSLQMMLIAVEGAADPAHADREVVLHDLANLGLAQRLVGTQGVLDARGRVLDAAADQAEVLRAVVILAELAQAPGQLGRRSE